ncbi:MAG: hypothetical protein B7X71_11620 [Polynucleobacter sp. 39-46-10]|jgi:predicted O-linked N-acetylglucosamine transferase (SPINDLY family)|nr:MAG: hypothetical protein B7X71_11620 [Polynucleobacter sp. 39-46-10]
MNPQVGYLMNLAIEYIQREDLDGAHRLLNQAMKMSPRNSELLRLLGVLSAFKNNRQEALTKFDLAIKLDKKNWLAHTNRGNILKDLQRYDEAMKSYDLAIALQSNYAEVHNNKGNLLQDLREYTAAVACYQKAIDLQPDYADAYENMGNALLNLKRPRDALSSYKKSVSIGSEKSVNIAALIHCKMKLCDWSDVDQLFNSLITISPSNRVKMHPFYLLSFVDDPFLIKKFTSEYISSEYFPKPDLGLVSKSHKSEKIRIGYFSGDFRNHPVAFLIKRMLELHNKDIFELIAFSIYVGTPDQMTIEIQNSFDHFFDVSMYSDFAIAEMARKLNLDIAVDLGGITKDARLGIFSYRVAPIQISYIGYLGTLAAPYIDYIIADSIIIPSEFQDAYDESIIYLPSYQANDNRTIISDKEFTREELGLPEEGIIYCCFNNNYKFTPSIFDSWMRILSSVEKSVLFLYADNDDVKINLIEECEARGVDSSRIVFAGHLPRAEYLARYKVADLFLDTSPYNAGTTASDALWAGLPVLTFLGKSFSSRMCGSLLNAIGLPELIAPSQDEYEKLAIRLGQNPKELIALKNKLAYNKLTTPLFDSNSFTKNLESAYMKAHDLYKRGLPPENIY